MTFYELLVIMHVVGTVLGAGAATFAHVFHERFSADGVVSDDERKTLVVTYSILRIGLSLLVISGFAFLLDFRLHERVGIFTSPSFWAKMTVVGVLLSNAILLQARLIPLAVGATVSLTSWYTALVLGVIGKTTFGYMEILLYYVTATVIVGIALRWWHSRHVPHQNI